MTQEELKIYIDAEITSKTAKGSITPIIHGNTLKKVVDSLYSAIDQHNGSGSQGSDMAERFYRRKLTYTQIENGSAELSRYFEVTEKEYNNWDKSALYVNGIKLFPDESYERVISNNKYYFHLIFMDETSSSVDVDGYYLPRPNDIVYLEMM